MKRTISEAFSRLPTRRIAAGTLVILAAAGLSLVYARHQHSAHAIDLTQTATNPVSQLTLNFTTTLYSAVDVQILDPSSGAVDADFPAQTFPGGSGTILTITGSALAGLDNSGYYDIKVTPQGYLDIIVDNQTDLSDTTVNVEASHPLYIGDFDGNGHVNTLDIDKTILDYNGTSEPTVTAAFGHVPSLGDVVTVVRDWHEHNTGDQFAPSATPSASASASPSASASASASPAYSFDSGPSGATSFSFTSADRSSRLAKYETGMYNYLVKSSSGTDHEHEDAWLLDTANNHDISTRDLPNAALAEFETGNTNGAANADALLSELFSQQNTVKCLSSDSTCTYGEIPWCYQTPAGVTNGCTVSGDYNADEFANQAIGPILDSYSSQLDPSLLSSIKTVDIPASIFALKRQTTTDKTQYYPRKSDVCSAYTNMCLMATTDIILESEAIGDSDDAQYGYNLLASWIAYTKTAGISEYDSPTYYGTDLNSLYMGYEYTQNAAAKAEYKAILDYFWYDLAANDYMPKGILAGAHSRDYDFIQGDGGADFYLYLEGLRANQSLTIDDFEAIYAYLGISASNAYHPSSAITSLAVSGTRTVWQDWYKSATNPDTTDTRETYITGDYAIGTASNNYGNQDKQFDLDLNLPTGVSYQPDITIVPNDEDDPYGFSKVNDSTGHSKQYHMLLNPVFAQSKNAVLGQIELEPDSTTDMQDMSTSIILPYNAAGSGTGGTDLVYNGAVVPISKNMAPVPVSQSTATFGILDGTDASGGYAGAVIRIFHVDACAGDAPSLDFQTDPTPSDGVTGDDGWDHGAMRLRIFHTCPSSATYASVPTIRIGMLAVAAHFTGDSDLETAVSAVQDTAISDVTSGSDWDVNVPNIAGVSLETERVGNTIKKRYVNGMPITGGVFDVNGSDISNQIWDQLSS